MKENSGIASRRASYVGAATFADQIFLEISLNHTAIGAYLRDDRQRPLG